MSQRPRHTHPFVSGCQEACERCLDLLDALTESQFAQPVSGHASIGAHMRHCLEHFTCFFDGLDACTVDYDARRREPLLERDPAACRAAYLAVCSRLQALEQEAIERPLTVMQTPAPDVAPQPVASTVSRELAFLSSHCIHHVALMNLLAERQGCQPTEGSGVAYATAAYEASRRKG